MEGGWLPRPEIVASTGGGVDAVLEIPADAPWFSGHFPGSPVLPGVVWLHAAAELVRGHVRRAGRPLEVTGFRNVRFLRRVEGAARVTVTVASSNGAGSDELRLDVRIDGEQVCRGLIAVREAGEQGT